MWIIVITNKYIHLLLEHMKLPIEVNGKLSSSAASDEKKGASQKEYKTFCNIN